MVIGGYDSGYINSIEVVDLANPNINCFAIDDYPRSAGGMAVGVIGGIIKSCGSLTDTVECYDFNPITNLWSDSMSLPSARSYPKSSFIDDVWLVSGDYISGDENFANVTEMWRSNRFEPGPAVPVPMYNHCQLTINSTHIFFADVSSENPTSHLLDWHSQTWTELPPPSLPDADYPSCGLIDNPENGVEAVIVHRGVSQIFNFANLTWRGGPTLPIFDYAGYEQVGDTFVVVGGRDEAFDDAINTIYQFDQVNYEWIQMEQRLQVPRSYYPAVVAVPDDFVSCI